MPHVVPLLGTAVMLLLAAPAAVRWVRREHRLRVAVEAKLYGRPAVKDRNGKEIEAEVRSVSEEIAALRKDILSRPAMNGEWEDALTLIAEIRNGQQVSDLNHRDLQRKVSNIGGRVTRVERAIRAMSNEVGE